jgi:hypothetical protein
MDQVLKNLQDKIVKISFPKYNLWLKCTSVKYLNFKEVSNVVYLHFVCVPLFHKYLPKINTVGT